MKNPAHADIEDALVAIGLTSKEARFYLALLEIGISTVLPVAKKAKLKRTSIYNFIDKLIQLGLVSTFIKNNRHYYKAEHPDVLAAIIEAKKESILRSLPALEQVFAANDSQPAVKTVCGRAGIKRVIDSMLESRDKKIKAVIDLDSLMAVLTLKYWTDLADKAIEKGVVIHTLRHEDQKTRIPQYKFMRRSEYKDTTIVPRYIPEKIRIPNSMFVYDNTVVILSPENEEWALEIKSKSFSTSLRVFHQMVWEISSD